MRSPLFFAAPYPLDLSALGMGVPEIVPTHLRDGHPASHDHSAVGFGFERLADADFSALFETSATTLFGRDSVAWDQPDFMAPAWRLPHQPGHDWWVA